MKKTLTALLIMAFPIVCFGFEAGSPGGVTSITAGDSSITVTPTNGKGAVSIVSTASPAPDLACRISTGVILGLIQTGTTTANATSISAGRYFNDVKVSSSVQGDSLQSQVNSLYGTSLRIYAGGTTSPSSGYYISSTTIYSTPVTFAKTITTTGVIVSSWVVDLNNITSIPSGVWELEFYGQVNNASVNRVYFDVYDGTGTAMTTANFIAETYPSDVIANGNINEYFVSFSTGIIMPRTRYLSVVMKIDKVSGSNPLFNWYIGGQYDAHLTFPVLRADVSVLSVTGTSPISASPSQGSVNVSLTGTVPMANLPVVYSTGEVCFVFGDSVTVAGNLVGYYCDFPVAADIQLRSFKMGGLPSGSFTVDVSSCQTEGGTFVQLSTGEAVSSGTEMSNGDLKAWTISRGSTLPFGGWLRFRVTVASTVQQITAGLKYWIKILGN